MRTKTGRCLRASSLFLLPALIILFQPLQSLKHSRAFSAVPPQIRISILSKYSPKKITVKGAGGILFISKSSQEPETLQTEDREVRISCDGRLLKAEIKGGKAAAADRLFLSFPKRYTIELKEQGVRRILSGSLSVTAAGSLELAASLSTETYIAAAARSELGSLISGKAPAGAAAGWKQELVSAMETAIRSWIAAQKNRHSAKGYDLCDLTHCVHFAGLPAKETSAAQPGLLMYDEQGKPVNAFFHSACGGALAGPEVYWRSSPQSKYFRRGRDAPDTEGESHDLWCGASPHANWTAVLSFEEMNELAGMADVISSAPEYRQGRVSSLTFTTYYGEKRLVSAAAFLSKAGERLGWNRIKSNMFTIEKSGTGWTLAGHGLGHGTGLCQYGAAAQAQAGKTAAEILAFYYSSPLISN